MITTSPKDSLSIWIEKEKAALRIINAASNLILDNSVELVLFRRKLIDQTITDVIGHHEYAREFAKTPIDVELSAKIAETIQKLKPSPSRIDVGILAKQWNENETDDLESFIKLKLEKHLVGDNFRLQPKDVVLYGFGRIGRLAARILSEQIGKGEQLRLKAIVVRQKGDDDIDKRASLLRKDSVHGSFSGTVSINKAKNQLIINGNPVQMIYANHPSEIDYTAYGINNALVIDNMGIWKTREDLSQHLQAKGATQVLLTAPASGDITNVVYGVNHNELEKLENETIFSGASCTTNAIAPVIKLMQDNFGIEDGHIETVHAYTNDQNLIDNFHKKGRRGRSAPLNMVLTSTGAAKAVVKIFPELKGKFTANAVRVPTPNVSLAILSLNLKKTTDIETLNEMFRKASLEGELVEQIDYSSSPEHVSSDVIGNASATEIDSTNTLISENGKRAVIYAWYDNEYGYTCQVIRLAKCIANVRRLTYY